MAPLWALLAVFVAGTVKGTAGLGFPTLATPLLSLAIDVKTAVVLLILPNIVMDGLQFARRGAPTATIRRLLPLLIGGAIGTVIGTRLLVVLPARAVLLLLAGFVAGLWIQDRLEQRAFNRAVLALLGALGLWLVVRSVLA